MLSNSNAEMRYFRGKARYCGAPAAIQSVMVLISAALRQARGLLEVVEQLSGMRAICSMPPPLLQEERACTTLARKLFAASFAITNVVPPQCALLLGSAVVRRMYSPFMVTRSTCGLPLP